MRAFLAIDLPAGLRDRVSALQAELRVGRHVPEENLHLTLAFLDDQPEAVLGALHEALSEVTLPGFDLELVGLDLFGGKKPRLLYLKTKPAPALLDLHKWIKEVARGLGIDLPRERFRPHVTLARFRYDMIEEEAAKLGRFLASHGNVGLTSFSVPEFALYGSTLHPEGAVHEVLAKYSLG